MKRWLPALGCALVAGAFAAAAALAVARLPVAPGRGTVARAPAAAADTTTEEVAVLIDNFTFAPATIGVAAGTRVVWTNRNDSPHNVVGADEPRAFRSPVLDTGERFAFTFATPGTYRYFCSLHPHMQGTVVVR